MMSDERPFSIDVSGLRSRAKDRTPGAVETADRVGERHGFLERSPAKRRGRPRSPRTGQVHAKVLPHVSEGIAEEAKRRGVQQGVLIEEAWDLYVRQSSGGDGP